MGVRHNTTQRMYRRYVPMLFQTGSAAATKTIGRVYISQFQAEIDMDIRGIIVYNGGTVDGNVTVGIYSEGSSDNVQGGTLLGSREVALSGLNVAQEIQFTTPISLGAGNYFAAVEFSSGTTTVVSLAIAYGQNVWRYYDRGGGYGALTNPCPAVTTSTATPFVVVRTTK